MPDQHKDESRNGVRGHRMPFGTEIGKNGEVSFRIFAPSVERMGIQLDNAEEPCEMRASSDGWHSLTIIEAKSGSRYRYVLPDGVGVPDPASRFQPEDVDGPSQVIDADAFNWTDGEWRGRAWNEAILYELHVGTFTKEGTFDAALNRLDYLAELGVTAIELMCIADFAGNRNWGYDGVLIYAPDSAYGTPDAMRAFVDAAHARGIMILLDVVYNHFGPEGNYIPFYFPQIWSEKHETPWGRSLNFDGDKSEVVRDFIIHNALYWMEEFHVDGLRLDASHAMVDESAKNILEELHERVHSAFPDRKIHLILENEQNVERRLLRDSNGKELDYTAQWNHDITHLLGAVFTDLGEQGKEEETEKLGKALAEGFVIAAQERGESNLCTVPPTAFIAFIQTHDLIGNRVFGERIFEDAPENAIRAIAAVYLLLPQTPMMFMGEEWGASTPFPFFSDYHGELAEAVRKGRCEQLSKLDPAPTEEELKRAPDPQAESTLRSAQLNWDELKEEPHAKWLGLYRGLIAARKEHVIPLLADLTGRCGSGKVIAPGGLAISWRLRGGAKLHLACNLCNEARRGFQNAEGRLIWLEGADLGESELGPWTVRWAVQTQ